MQSYAWLFDVFFFFFSSRIFTKIYFFFTEFVLPVLDDVCTSTLYAMMTISIN